MRFRRVLIGVTVGYGAMAVHAVNVPVTVAGMDVSSGEIIHMDKNGACKFPADCVDAVLTNVRAFSEEKDVQFGRLLAARSAIKDREIFGG